MNRSLRRNKKAISTVIATIIIVAISIVMAISVAYWALGIGGSFTRFEKLQFTSAYATSTTEVIINMKNTGTAAATIGQILVNGQPMNDLDTVVYDPLTLTLVPGAISTATITFDTARESGMSIEFKIVTAAGNQYPQVVNMP